MKAFLSFVILLSFLVSCQNKSSEKAGNFDAHEGVADAEDNGEEEEGGEKGGEDVFVF